MGVSSLEKLIQNINNLQTLPTIYSSISSALADPLVTPDKLSKIISVDQVSSTKILKVANSPFYGFRGKIDTISQAVLFLGFNEIKNIIFALSVVNSFGKNKSVMNFKPVDLWAHSIGVGIATRMIGSALGEKSLENYFLAGIIHDIGKILFIEFIPDEYAKVLRLVSQSNCSVKQAEKEILSLDHCRAGQLLAEKWKLPLNLYDVIIHHHSGSNGKEPSRMLASVHIANIFVRALNLGNAGDNLVLQPNFDAWNIVKLPKGFFASVKKNLIEDFNHTASLMLFE